MSLIFTVSEILSLISQNLKRSRDSKHIPFGGILVNWKTGKFVNLYLNVAFDGETQLNGDI